MTVGALLHHANFKGALLKGASMRDMRASCAPPGTPPDRRALTGVRPSGSLGKHRRTSRSTSPTCPARQSPGRPSSTPLSSAPRGLAPPLAKERRARASLGGAACEQAHQLAQGALERRHPRPCVLPPNKVRRLLPLARLPRRGVPRRRAAEWRPSSSLLPPPPPPPPHGHAAHDRSPHAGANLARATLQALAAPRASLRGALRTPCGYTHTQR